MLSARWGERALPVAWRVEETDDAIGFPTQKDLLDAVRAWVPADASVILYADRFYGTPELIRLCRDRGWDYRLRLKGNLTARIGTRTTSTGELATSWANYFEAVALTGIRTTGRYIHVAPERLALARKALDRLAKDIARAETRRLRF